MDIKLTGRVEADETEYCHTPGDSRKTERQQWYFGIVSEKDQSQAVFYKVSDRKASTLEPLIARHTTPKQTVVHHDVPIEPVPPTDQTMSP